MQNLTFIQLTDGDDDPVLINAAEIVTIETFDGDYMNRPGARELRERGVRSIILLRDETRIKAKQTVGEIAAGLTEIS